MRIKMTDVANFAPMSLEQWYSAGDVGVLATWARRGASLLSSGGLSSGSSKGFSAKAEP
jgi:hypothetical protein